MPGHLGALLSSRDCESILFEFDKNAKVINYEITGISEKVLGFLAAHYFVTIAYSKIDQKGSFYQRFFLKAMPITNETQRSYVEDMGVFRKEILNYKNFLSEFSQLASRPFAPKYYCSKNADLLVIEDLSSAKYQVCNLEYLNYTKCVGALNAIARLHASSIIFEEQRSTDDKPYRLNEYFPEELIESTFSFRPGHVRNMWCKTATSCLEKLSKYFTSNEETSMKIRQYIFSEDGLKKYLKPSKVYRNTVCHDDLWCNNMMFNDKDECMLIDFQLTRYTPPVFDVLLLLFLGTEKNFLDENMDHLLNLYYRSLTSELSMHSIDIEKIISNSEFQNSVLEYTLPALVEACLYGTNVYLPEDVSSMVTSSPETFVEFTMKNRPYFIVEEFESNIKYRERYSTVLKPLFQAIEKI